MILIKKMSPQSPTFGGEAPSEGTGLKLQGTFLSLMPPLAHLPRPQAVNSFLSPGGVLPWSQPIMAETEISTRIVRKRNLFFKLWLSGIMSQ